MANKIIENESNSFGFDAQKEVYGDMLKFGIVDPTKVVRTALEGACSVSSLLLTTECAIVEKKDDDAKATPSMAGMNGQMGGFDY